MVWLAKIIATVCFALFIIRAGHETRSIPPTDLTTDLQCEGSLMSFIFGRRRSQSDAASHFDTSAQSPSRDHNPSRTPLPHENPDSHLFRGFFRRRSGSTSSADSTKASVHHLCLELICDGADHILIGPGQGCPSRRRSQRSREGEARSPSTKLRRVHKQPCNRSQKPRVPVCGSA